MVKKNIYPLVFTDCVLIEKQIYFVEFHIAALFSMDPYTGKVQYIDRLPNEMIVQVHSISKILNYKNILILIPARTSNMCIWLYDLKRESWNSIPFVDKGIRPPYEQFEYAVIYGKELFVVGCYYPAIICIDLENKKTTYYEIFENNMQLHSLGSCECIDDQLYIPSPNSNHVVMFNMKLKQHRCFCVGSESNSYSGILKSGQMFWLSPMKNTAMVKWNGMNEVTEYNLPDEFQNESGYIFNGIAVCHNGIFVYGLKNKLSFRFLPDQIESCEIIENSYLLFKQANEDCMITCDYRGNIQVILAGEKKEYICHLSDTEIERFMKEWQEELHNAKNIKLMEDDFISLERFLTVL